MHRVAVVVALCATACSGSDPSPEVVVRDASLGGAAPQVLGASSSSVFWTVGSMPTLVGASAVAALPATGNQVISADGPVAAAGDLVVFATQNRIAHVDAAGMVQGVASGAPDAIAGSAAITAWSMADTVSWLVGATQASATLTRVNKCAQLRVTSHQIYAVANGSTDGRLFRIDQGSAAVTQIASAASMAAQFPGGGMAGATYSGRIVDADDTNALWLVEEAPSHRAILVAAAGDSTVVLDHVMNATGFFASPTDLYWQEGDELLTAPRAGGAASIITSLPGPAGAFADGYIYYVNGIAIERLRVE